MPSDGAGQGAMNDPTLEAMEVALVPFAETIRREPSATIRPRADTETGTTQRLHAAVAQLRSAAKSLVMEGELGRGGMGVVHLATQEVLGRKVAVKTLHPGLAANPDALRLLQEAWVTGVVEHPNVVPIHDVGIREDGAPLVVLKRIEGVPWSALLADGTEVCRRFGVEDALDWHLRTLMQVCTAIHFAHVRGILHRDLKPDNVMIGAYGEVYVLDWGIAVSLRDDGADLLPLVRNVRDVAGTPAYMAPEMLQRDGAGLGARTDVYLLGGLLHAVLTGRPPHQGTTPITLALDALREDYEFDESTPPELAMLCQRALCPDPARRFQTAEEVRHALQRFLDHRHSDGLAARATARLRALLRQVEAPRRGFEDQLEVYRLFGECRFGFRQALESWPANAPAAEGLVRATRALVEWELAANNAAAAAAALAELEAPPADLVARVGAAREVAEAERRRVEEARLLASRYDAAVGRRTRIALAVLVCAMWIALPLRRLLAGEPPTYAVLRWAPLAYLAAVALLGWSFRRLLLAHAFNRTVMTVVALAVVAQWALYRACEMAGLPADVAIWQSQFLAFVASGLLAVCLVPRLAFASAVYLACYLVGASQPTWRDLLLVIGNVSLLVNSAFIWSARLRRAAAA